MSTLKSIGLALSATKNLSIGVACLTVGLTKYQVLTTPMAIRALLIGVKTDEFRTLPTQFRNLYAAQAFGRFAEGANDIRELCIGSRTSMGYPEAYGMVMQAIEQNEASFEDMASKLEAHGMTRTPSTLSFWRNPEATSEKMFRALSPVAA